MGRPAEFVTIAHLNALLRNTLRHKVSANDIRPVMKGHGFSRITNKLNGKSADMWVRGEWGSNGAGMIQHAVTREGNHHTITRPGIKAPVPPPPPLYP